MKKVQSDRHPDFVKLLNQQGSSRPARIEVTARGYTYVEEKRFPKGSPSPDADTYMTDEELTAKFRNNADGVLCRSSIDRIADLVLSLEDVTDFGMVMRLASRKCED